MNHILKKKIKFILMMSLKDTPFIFFISTLREKINSYYFFVKGMIDIKTMEHIFSTAIFNVSIKNIF